MTFLGKSATWMLYAALGFVLVTRGGDDVAGRLLWIGVAFALGSRRAVRGSARAERTAAGRASRTRRRASKRSEVSS